MAQVSSRPHFRLPDRSLGLRIASFFAGFVGVVFGGPVMRWLWQFATTVAIAVGLTLGLRADRPLWLQATYVAAAVLVIGILRWTDLMIVRIPRVAAWVGGPPMFTSLDVMPLRTFRYIVRTVAGAKVTAEPEDQPIFDAMAELAEESVKREARRKYVERYGEEGWDDAWEEISGARVGDMSLIETLRSGLVGTVLFNTRLIQDYLTVFLAIYLGIVYVFIATRVLAGDALLASQVTLVSGLSIAGFTFLMSTIGFRRLTVLDPTAVATTVLPSEAALVTEESLEESARAVDEMSTSDAFRLLEENTGREMTCKVEFEPLYVRTVRNLIVRQTFVLALEMSLMVAIILAAQWGLGLLVSEWSGATLETWTIRMLLAAALVPVAIALAVFLGFLLFTQINRFVGVLLGAVVSAVLPPLLSYILGVGSPETVGLISMVSAVVGAVPIAVAEFVKKQPPSK